MSYRASYNKSVTVDRDAGQIKLLIDVTALIVQSSQYSREYSEDVQLNIVL